MKVFYSDAYVRAGYEFDTVRKSSWIAQSLRDAPIPDVEIVEPQPVTVSDLEVIHDPVYVEAIRTGTPAHMAESQGFPWDPGLWKSVCASTGGTLAAALTALEEGVSGSLSSGLHHARRGRGAGFCTFNGIALAAHAVTRARSGDVLILDLDAHCGGGTASLIKDSSRIWQLDVAVDSFDSYTAATGRGALEIVRSADRYLEAVKTMLARCGPQPSAELVLYNAGMDPFQGCDTGGLSGISEQVLEERECTVFEWAAAHGLPVAFVLAGGYVGPRLPKETLVALHRHTVRFAAGAFTTLPVGAEGGTHVTGRLDGGR
jgi:acetoin utilization deacetylase AcuC-like enzyme